MSQIDGLGPFNHRPMETNEPQRSGAEALLAQEAWLRRLARGLLADLSLADDLAQDVLTLALAKPPRASGAGLRAWLATVARRMAKRRASREGVRHRVEHEASSSAREAQDAAHRIEVSESLLAALRCLDQPSRTAVVMRFYEEADYDQIASRLGLSPSAARQRVSRGLAALRVRLDDELGERCRWLPALGFLAGAPTRLQSSEPVVATSSVSLITLIAPMKKVVLVASAVLAVFVPIGSWWANPDLNSMREPGRAPGVVELEASRQQQSEESLVSATEPLLKRELVTATARTATPPPSNNLAPRLHFVTAMGGPATGVRAAWVSPKGKVHKVNVDASATAELPKGGVIVASQVDLSTIFHPLTGTEPSPDREGNVTVTLLPRQTLQGRVEVSGEAPTRILSVFVRPTFDDRGLSRDWTVMSEQVKDLRAAGILLSSPRTTRTRKDGSFEVKGLDAHATGSVQLGSSFHGAKPDVPAGAAYRLPTEELIVSATALPYLHGRLVWADNEAPLDGDVIVYFSEVGRGTGFSASSILGADGEFEVGIALDPDSSEEGALLYSSVVLDAHSSSRAACNATFTLELPGHELPWNVGTLSVERARTLEFAIVDDHGVPVEGARAVTVANNHMVSDAKGRLSLPVAYDTSVEIQAMGYLPRSVEVPVAEPNGTRSTAPLVVRLEPSGLLRVFPKNFEAEGIQTARARLCLEFDPLDLLSGTRGGPDPAKARYEWIMRSTWRFNRALQPQLRRTLVPGDLWTITAFASDEPLVLGPLRPGASIRVALLDVFGNPLARQDVSVREAGERTDVQLDVAELDVCKLTVLATDEAGVPVPNAQLTTRGGRFGERVDGAITVAPLGKGRFHLGVSAPGFLATKLQGEVNQTEQTVTAVMVQARRLHLQFIDPDGTAIRPDSISLTSSDGQGIHREEWDPQSKSQPFREVPAGPLSVEYRLGTAMFEHSFDTLESSYAVPTERVGSLKIELSELPSVSGTWGKVVATITDEADGDSQVVLRESYTASAIGELTLRTLALPGIYHVEVKARDSDLSPAEGTGTSLFPGQVEVTAHKTAVLKL